MLAFVNSAAGNMGCMYLSKLEFLRGVGLLDRMAALFLVFFFPKIVLPLSQRRQWHPTPVLLPGKSHGQRSLLAAIYGVAQSWT